MLLLRTLPTTARRTDGARMISTLWIPLPMPGRNEQERAARSHWSVAAKLKTKWAQIVKLYANSQRFPVITGPAHFEFEFVEPNRKRDPDNVVGGGTKVIFDALQEAKLLANDGWEHV